MALEVYWGSGSPYAWRVLLALERKRLPYESHLLQFSKQEHKSPQMLKMNFRGQVPVIKDGEYVCFESLAILYYLDLKYPTPRIFGHTPEEAGTIMRVICEYQSYAEVEINKFVGAVFSGGVDLRSEAIAHAMHLVGGEARTIEGRLSKSDWVVGEEMSAADMVIFPGIQLLLRALSKPAAADLRSRFLPLDVHYPAIARWIHRVEAQPGYERTYPPHWREAPAAPSPAVG
jgi:glutathione S-transferase